MALHEQELILNPSTRTVHLLEDPKSWHTKCGRTLLDGVKGWMWTESEATPCTTCTYTLGKRLKAHRPAVKLICVECHGTVEKYRTHYHYVPDHTGEQR